MQPASLYPRDGTMASVRLVELEVLKFEVGAHNQESMSPQAIAAASASGTGDSRDLSAKARALGSVG